MIDLRRVEVALTYALESHLGKSLKPISHRGAENPFDLMALEVLKELRKEIANVPKTT